MAEIEKANPHAPGTQEHAHRNKILANEKDLVRVKFLIGQPPYNAGETAGFPKEIAERLVSATIKTPNGAKKVAEYADKSNVLKPTNDAI